MSTLVQAGACTKCGAPIWVPAGWTDTNNAPPAKYSCACPRPTATGANESSGNNGGRVLNG